jgi:hypothetical protein
VDDSIVFYAAGEIPYHNHIGVTLINRKLTISLDFGNTTEGEVTSAPITTEMGEELTDGTWHVLTIYHQRKVVTVTLDGKERNFEVPGNQYYLYIDPDIYVGGGGPRLQNRQGMESKLNWILKF